jgi:uncharacterized protein (TIGR03437 family)
LTNAGSYANFVASPGEALVIFGKRFGPPALVTAALVNGKFSTVIGETRVLFDGVAAPMIYAVDGQVSCLAPFALAGKTATVVEVEYKGREVPADSHPCCGVGPRVAHRRFERLGQSGRPQPGQYL